MTSRNTSAPRRPFAVPRRGRRRGVRSTGLRSRTGRGPGAGLLPDRAAGGPVPGTRVPDGRGMSVACLPGRGVAGHRKPGRRAPFFGAGRATRRDRAGGAACRVGAGGGTRGNGVGGAARRDGAGRVACRVGVGGGTRGERGGGVTRRDGAGGVQGTGRRRRRPRRHRERAAPGPRRALRATYRPPRSSDATAATRQAAIAKSNAMASPCSNGAEIREGKKVWPVRNAAWLAGSRLMAGPAASAPGCSRAGPRTGSRPGAARRPAPRPPGARPGRSGHG